MRENYINQLFCILLLCCLGCNQETPQIRVVAERMDEDTYLFRWEVLPPMKGSVTIYSSLNPTSFDYSQHPVETDILNGSIQIPVTNKDDRYFFLLKFNNSCAKEVASRFAFSDALLNLRDIGGYANKEEKNIKWGKIYRSGNIDVPKKEKDIRVINQMQLKTIIDFKEEKEKNYKDSSLNFAKTINIPIPDLLTPDIIDMVIEGKMKKGDVILYMQEKYLEMYEHADFYFKPMFDILLDTANYPLLITSTRGKDRTGFAIALIMTAIGVPDETIIEDYLLSGKHINATKYKSLIKNLTWEEQEAMTSLLNPQEKVIDMVRERIIYDYGSTDKFLEKKLQLDKAKRKKLKALLLY